MAYIDQNVARNPKAPLELLFCAIFALKPGFDVRNINVVTDRNNIQKILRFINMTAKGSFQIQVEIVNGKTTLFTCMQPDR
jgi:hypothetical protein